MKIRPTMHSARFLVTHRALLWRVAVSELRARYAGSILGFGWAVLSPLLILLLYAAIYLVIFQVRAPGLTPIQYVLLIFSGLVPFLMTSEALSSSVGSVVANKDVLSNTVFPIDLVPAKAVLLSQVTMLVGAVFTLGGVALWGRLTWMVIFFPVLWLLHVLGLIGLSWMLSLINLVFRDLQNIVSLVLMIMMVVSPIAYTPDMVPSTLKVLLLLNPFAYFVIAYQSILVLGELPAWWHIVVILILSVGVFVMGGYFFSRAKRVFIDYV